MKIVIEKITSTDFEPVSLLIDARVRYWEDATVNGVEDTDGQLIPCRDGDLWNPEIDFQTGHINGWPEGTTADIHYKVCDGGQYWLIDKIGRRVKYTSDYVPNGVCCMGDNGYGDYIILSVDDHGKIQNWNPCVDGDDWEDDPS